MSRYDISCCPLDFWVNSQMCCFCRLILQQSFEKLYQFVKILVSCLNFSEIVVSGSPLDFWLKNRLVRFYKINQAEIACATFKLYFHLFIGNFSGVSMSDFY